MTFRNYLTGCLWLVIVLVLVGAISIYFGLLRLPLMNINREVTQHSQQYIETKRSLLLSLLTDYQQADGQAGRQEALRQRICEEATLIDPDEYPGSVATFVAREC